MISVGRDQRQPGPVLALRGQWSAPAPPAPLAGRGRSASGRWSSADVCALSPRRRPRPASAPPAPRRARPTVIALTRLGHRQLAQRGADQLALALRDAPAAERVRAAAQRVEHLAPGRRRPAASWCRRRPAACARRRRTSSGPACAGADRELALGRRSRSSAGSRRSSCTSTNCVAGSVAASRGDRPRDDLAELARARAVRALHRGDDAAVLGQERAGRPRTAGRWAAASFRSPASSSRMNDDQISIAALPAK